MRCQNYRVKVFLIVLVITSFAPAVFSAGAIMSWKDEKGQVHFGDRPPDASNIDDENVSVIREASMFSAPEKEKKPAKGRKLPDYMDPDHPDYYNPVNQIKRAKETKRLEQIKAYQQDPRNSKPREVSSKLKKDDPYRRKIIEEDKQWARENGYISTHDKDWKKQVVEKCLRNNGSDKNCNREKYINGHKPVSRNQRDAIDERNANYKRGHKSLTKAQKDAIDAKNVKHWQEKGLPALRREMEKQRVLPELKQ